VLATGYVPAPYGTMRVVRPTVLIVDDHAAFRASARALLHASGFDVIGEAADGAAAIEAVLTLRPEIVVLDVQLPDLDGLAVAARLAEAPEPPVVVLVSSREAAAYGPRLERAPARGFIVKSELSGPALAAMIGLDVRCGAGTFFCR
jgi:DNA-binding NarL/FixJ family response regulator